MTNEELQQIIKTLDKELQTVGQLGAIITAYSAYSTSRSDKISLEAWLKCEDVRKVLK